MACDSNSSAITTPITMSRPSDKPTPPSRATLGGSFRAAMFRHPGKGGWTFVEVPDRLSPPVTHGWGRTPVRATVDDHAWDTSVWRGRDGRTLLAVPKAARGTKQPGDIVRVRLVFRSL